MPPLSSHAPFSLQIAEYDECMAVLLLSVCGLKIVKFCENILMFTMTTVNIMMFETTNTLFCLHFLPNNAMQIS